MKKIAVYVGAAFLGSICTFLLIGVSQSSVFTISDKAAKIPSSTNIQQVSYSDAQQNALQTDFVKASAKVMPAVVHIATKATIRTSSTPPGFELWQEFFGPQWEFPQEKSNIQQGAGSGVIVQNNGYIVTNNHVIQGVDEITVTLHDKRTFSAKVIGSDPNTDIALLKIEADSLPVISFANSDDVKVGEWVLAVGNP
ncbi:MAG: S1C family serine protease, partial [Bacteroidales bacterium]|nr:S1C family serine protease [Bacteroidales bacterium]